MLNLKLLILNFKYHMNILAAAYIILILSSKFAFYGKLTSIYSNIYYLLIPLSVIYLEFRVIS